MVSFSNLFLPLALFFGAQSASQDEKPEDAERAFANARGAILRADGNEAIRILSNLKVQDLAEDDQALAACALDRLTSTEHDWPWSKVTSPIVRALLVDYHSYWRDGLNRTLPIELAQDRLVKQVSKTLGIKPPADIAVLEGAIAERLRSEGFYSLQGKTGKLRELMIWRAQSERTHTVDLPEDQVTTRVFYLDDFVSGGWSSYFACNRTGTAGWAKPDALYVVVPRWKSLNDERFQVSFLAHESQHYCDFAIFPDLKGWELEYRAKLVELALTEDSSDRLIKRFEANQSNDATDAHSFANAQILTAIRRKLSLPVTASLSSATTLEIQTTARELLLEDSQLRRE